MNDSYPNYQNELETLSQLMDKTASVVQEGKDESSYWPAGRNMLLAKIRPMLIALRLELGELHTSPNLRLLKIMLFWFTIKFGNLWLYPSVNQARFKQFLLKLELYLVKLWSMRWMIMTYALYTLVVLAILGLIFAFITNIDEIWNFFSQEVISLFDGGG